jgi:two-component system chemotaxis response regulator CheY
MTQTLVGTAALVVDDSAAMRTQLTAVLRGLGVVCDEASDGADGWRKLTAGSFDVILTDINMPVMDGLKLVGLIRAAGAHRKTPIVIISANGAEGDRRRGLALGANAYLVKPIHREELAATLTRLLIAGRGAQLT